MRVPRSRQFDPAAPPWLHCVSRCVRRAFLCGDGFEHRRAWIEGRLQMLASLFAVDVAAYAVMSNHLHVVIRPRPEQVGQWSPQRIAETWLRIKHAGLDTDPGKALARLDGASQAYVEVLSQDQDFVETWRERFSSASWFMKTLKEPISRAANREDECTGAFWEGRYNSTPLLDEAALLTCMAYVDLNPIRAGIAATPETSAHTSIAHRAKHRRARRQAEQAAQANSASQAREALEAVGLGLAPGHTLGHLQSARDDQAVVPWLAPINGLLGELRSDFGPENYLRLVDATGRIIRGDKRGAIAAETAAILDRLNCDHEAWITTMAKPKSLLGAALGHLAAREREVRRRCCQWLQVRCPIFAAATAQ